MAFKIKKRSNLTGKVEFAGPFEGAVAEIRYVSPEHNRELVREARRNATDDDVANERHGKAYCDTAVIGLKGVTPAMLEAAIELEDDSDKPEINGDGCVSCNRELIYAIWRGAQPQHFQNQIFAANQQLLVQAAAEKKRLADNSGG